MIIERMRDERGISLVMASILIVVLLGMVALTVDIGRLYLVRQYLVNCCDAAALAGGMELPDESDATAKASDCALANGMVEHQVSFPADGMTANGPTKIRVDGQRVVPYGFARILGFESRQVGAYAVVLKTGPVGWAENVVPWGIPEVNYNAGDTVTLKLGSQHSLQQSDLQGNFYPLCLASVEEDGTCGGDVYRDDVTYGYEGVVSAGDPGPGDGDIVLTEPGNMVGPTNQAVDYRFEQAAANPEWADDTCADVDYGNPRVVVVPIVSPMGAGRTDVEVLGFAAFYLLGVQGGEVTGCFIDYTIPNAGGSGDDYGVATFRLIE